MPQQLNSMFARLKATIGEFTLAQRTIALIGIAVLILGMTTLAMWATKPSYTPLFSGLNAADASAIVDQLRTDGVPYELSQGGATILVPEESVYDQRLKAAAAGMPTSSTGGYGLLDDMGVTSSEFQQSVTYKRALEGELASTISSLAGVRAASVRLAIPEKTVFVSQHSDPTASVFVETERGVSLNSEQVQAIVHLTSASIDGMKPSDVAVIAADGTVLSTVGVGATGTADKQASDYELRVRTAVQTMLDRVVGPGSATVAVAVEMNYETAERVEESFALADGAPALNESVSTEAYEGSGQSAAGVLGPDNIAVPAGEGGSGTFNSESTTRNNAVNKVTESRIIPSGSINRQTVSVAVDQAVAGSLDMAAVTALVSSAAGLNPERGDQVAVEVVPFNTSGAEAAAAALAEAAAAAEAERANELMRTGIIAAAVLAAFIVALIVLAIRARRNRRSAGFDALDQTLHMPAVGAGIPTELLPVAAPLEIQPPPLDEAQAEMDRKRAEIEALAENDPEKAADYFRSLMDDRQQV